MILMSRAGKMKWVQVMTSYSKLQVNLNPLGILHLKNLRKTALRMQENAFNN